MRVAANFGSRLGHQHRYERNEEEEEINNGFISKSYRRGTIKCRNVGLVFEMTRNVKRELKNKPV